MSARVIRSNQSLVLQKVTRASAGQYACAATNQQGDGVSNELDFRVKFAPVCRHEKILVVGASRHERVDISCEVEADPPATSFRWKFNNSGETMDVSPVQFSSNGSASLLRYKLNSDHDYGTLSCWAENSVGHQGAPCVYQVVAAGKPFPVRNCTLFNQTSTSVEVSCIPGFDGGLPQRFLLELYTEADLPLPYETEEGVITAGGVSTRPLLSMTSERPMFTLADLEPEVAFRVAVFAVNSKGRSSAVVLDEVTFRDPEKRTGESNSPIRFRPAGGPFEISRAITTGS
ncbi:hypothetical protein J437_LFUL002793, partial [Ladona fulva]